LLAIFRAVRARFGTRAVLTASAVELAISGNLDMMIKSDQQQRIGANGIFCSEAMGIAIDKTTKPPKLYGMSELSLDSEEDLLKVFAAIASRNTAGTGLNDSSSRSHCFAFLTLHVHEAESDAVRTSRFQFVDLAGSERLKDAHSGMTNYRTDGAQVIAGMVTNYSLMMLSTCVRAFVDAQRQGRAKGFSFRAYIGDLTPLLEESMTGHALTAIFVCVSQAPDNEAQSRHALDFGEVFAQLAVRPRVQQAKPRKELATRHAALLRQAKALSGGKDKYAAIRTAQVAMCSQFLAVLGRFD